MKTKFYVGLGAFAAIAAMLTLASQGVHNATADEVTGQQGIEQQDTNQFETDTQREVDQIQTRETREYGRRDARQGHDAHKNTFKASELLGMNVRGSSGDDDIGEISDLMISKDGRVVYAAVSFGGFLGLGDKLFAVPLEAIEFVKHEDDSYARMDVTEQSLENKKGFNQDNWPQQANREFVGGLGQRQAERPETDGDVSR